MRNEGRRKKISEMEVEHNEEAMVEITKPWMAC